jgi:hypothetical protein
MKDLNYTLTQAKEKYSEIHENGRDYGVHKSFDIYINDRPYAVYRIRGYEHIDGDGKKDDWWLDYSYNEKEEPLLPYRDRGVHRTCWEINYKQRNGSRHKYGCTTIGSYGLCTLKANGKEVYKLVGDNLEFMMANISYKIRQLMEHPYNFLDPESEVGRKIYYYGLPATIRTGYEVGEINIIPDYEKIPKNRWWKLYELKAHNTDEDPGDIDDMEVDKEDMEDHKKVDSINHGDALWDGRIGWFRN